MTRIGVITQARMTSSRLPGKILLNAGGETMLSHHLNRLGAARYPVVVATTTNGADDPVVEAARASGVDVFRGSEDDVLGRFAGAAREHEFDVVVRVTSDCPLIDGELVGAGIQRFIDAADEDLYLSNTLQRTYPRGLDFEVFSTKALLDADAKAESTVEREHVTPYLYGNTSRRMVIRSIRRAEDASRFRLTLDVPEDLLVLTELIERHSAALLGAEELIALLEAHPDIAAINSAVEQKKLGQ